jgi:hypothetical protein
MDKLCCQTAGHAIPKSGKNRLWHEAADKLVTLWLRTKFDNTSTVAAGVVGIDQIQYINV